MSSQNVTFFTQNNCFQGASARNFNNENYYVLHHRVNLQSCFQKPSAKTWLFLRSFTSGRQKLRPVLKFLSPFTWLYITVWFLCLRIQQRNIERVMDLTDSFTWEDLPTRDAETGHLTAAGWIPLIQTYTTRGAVVMTVYHNVQSLIRILPKHETMYTAWYPFDWTVSPFYELVNISQVMLYTK